MRSVSIRYARSYPYPIGNAYGVVHQFFFGTDQPIDFSDMKLVILAEIDGTFSHIWRARF